jgi:hypothetical protein
MLSLLTGLKQTQTKSVLGLRSALSSQRSNVAELLKINLIHQRFLDLGGIHGRLGFPTSNVQFEGTKATRQYRGGGIQILGDGVHLLPRQVAKVFFVGFRCVRESTSDGLSPKDEPYFIISADPGNGRPAVKKFGPFENVETGTEISVGDLLIDDIAPNPLTIRVQGYERDHGDPDQTAKNIQEEVVKLSKEAENIAGAAGAADGPGIGQAAAAGTIGGIAGGPLGALVAAAIVAALDLGDDFVGQNARLHFLHPNDVGTPPVLGQFQGNEFNDKIVLKGGDEGEYELFFFVQTLKKRPDEEQ